MDILSLGLVGAVVSLFVNETKRRFGTSGWQTIIILAVVSTLAGLGSWLLQNTNILKSAFEILISANAIYTLLWKQLANK